MAGLEGTSIGGCVLRRPFGGSGTHEVFLAERGEPAQPVAVKLALDEGVTRAERTIARLSHPHILPLVALADVVPMTEAPRPPRNLRTSASGQARHAGYPDAVLTSCTSKRLPLSPLHTAVPPLHAQQWRKILKLFVPGMQR